jgi:putative transposase
LPVHARIWDRRRSRSAARTTMFTFSVFFSKIQAISELVKELKRESSQWAKSKGPKMKSFYWQNGYGAFSISPSHVNALIKYIENQEEHHKKESFQDEFRRLLKKYGVEFDERYVWD